eukprot:gene2359-4576_t
MPNPRKLLSSGILINYQKIKQYEGVFTASRLPSDCLVSASRCSAHKRIRENQ